uniref:Uncharacterized protein n=1 Tax=Globodera rostochiensis TaxID=31243 RepID=A0A914HBQ8_GLORO
MSLRPVAQFCRSSFPRRSFVALSDRMAFRPLPKISLPPATERLINSTNQTNHFPPPFHFFIPVPMSLPPADDGSSVFNVLLLLFASTALLVVAFVLLVLFFRYAFPAIKCNVLKTNQNQMVKNIENRQNETTAAAEDLHFSTGHPQVVFHEVSLADTDNVLDKCSAGRVPEIVLTNASPKMQRL